MALAHLQFRVYVGYPRYRHRDFQQGSEEFHGYGVMVSSVPINILCATDNGYAPYCGIMLTSLFENNKECEMRVFVFVDKEFSTVNRRKYERLGRKYGCPILVTIVEDSLLEGFPVYRTSHAITLPTYFRLLAAKLLPEDVRRVIYLDCDIIVRGSLMPLWEMDMEGMIIAGVKDSGNHYQVESFDQLGYPTSWGYFNAGVLVIDLSAWRLQGVDQQILSFINEYGDKLTMMDQDVLNGVLFDRKKFLPERYNFQMLFFRRWLRELYPESFQTTLRNEQLIAVIIHYCDTPKPWCLTYQGEPYHSEWDKYRKKSSWKCSQQRPPFRKLLVRWVKRNLFPNLYNCVS